MQSITKAMIRHRFEAEFGDDVKIEWMVRGWHVTTSDGDVEIHPKSIKKILGGHRTHRAVVLLMKDAGRKNITVEGSADFLASMVAHGEALDMPVQPIVKQSGGGCLKFFFCPIAFIFGCGVVDMFFGEVLGLLGGIASLILVWKVISRAQKNEALRAGQAYRLTAPQLYGDRQARYEEARRRGII